MTFVTFSIKEFRILVCGGRRYGEQWDYAKSRWVRNEEECRRFTRVMGNCLAGLAEGRAIKSRGAPPNDPPIWATSSSPFGYSGRDTSACIKHLRSYGVEPIIIHGGATGADALGGEFAKEHGLKEVVFKADWTKHGRAAGPRRNHTMLLNGKPDVTIAFPGGNGTKHMADISEKDGVPTWRVRE